MLCLASNCTPKPPDVPICKHLRQFIGKDPVTEHMILKPSPRCWKEIQENECGVCTFIVTGKQIFVGEKKEHWYNDKPWSMLRAQSLLAPAVESYAPLSEYIVNSCQKMGCDDKVTGFKVKIDGLNGLEDALK